jgi:hypothetical protein
MRAFSWRLCIPILIAAAATVAYGYRVGVPFLWIVAAPAATLSLLTLGLHYSPVISAGVFFFVACGWFGILLSPLLFRAAPWSTGTMGRQMLVLLGAALTTLVCFWFVGHFLFAGQTGEII